VYRYDEFGCCAKKYGFGGELRADEIRSCAPLQ